LNFNVGLAGAAVSEFKLTASDGAMEDNFGYSIVRRQHLRHNLLMDTLSG
jgi:hypothetical protein